MMHIIFAVFVILALTASGYVGFKAADDDLNQKNAN